MEISLVNPNTRRIGRVATTNPPLGLLYIASYLRSYGYDVKFIDADVDDLSLSSVMKLVQSSDVVGVTMVTLQALAGYELVNRIKMQFSDKTVVVGGAHPSCMRERIFSDFPNIDFSVLGEGEQTMLELCRAIEDGSPVEDVSGLCYKKNCEVVFTESRQRLDPNTLPFPAVDLAMPIDRYKPYYPPNRGRLAFPVMASRGCPYNCKFCGSKMVWTRTVKAREPSQVVDEVEWLHDNFGVDEVYYLDDTLNLNRKWLHQLCDEHIRRGLNETMWFKGSVRANRELCDPETFSLAKEAGFWLFALGVESGNQQILNDWNKNLTLEEIERCVKLLKNAELKVVASAIIGSPLDNFETVNESIRFMQKLAPDYYDFPLATPLPNTAFEQEAKALGLIQSVDWEKYAMGRAVCKTKYLSLEDLETLRSYAFSLMAPMTSTPPLWKRALAKVKRSFA